MSKTYNIQELSTICKVSKTSIYNQFKKNQAFVKENSRKEKPNDKNSKAVIKYNQSVLDWLLTYYAPAVSENKEDEESFSNQLPHGEPGKPIASPDLPELAVNSDIRLEELEAENKLLKTQLEEIKNEKAEIQKQLGIALLCLQQEKAEKQQLLPAPKKSIGEKLKSIFSGKK